MGSRIEKKCWIARIDKAEEIGEADAQTRNDMRGSRS